MAQLLKSRRVVPDSHYIDFISSYCDRWCERCAFTERCATFAAEAAIAMCGDVDAGIELAMGTPAVASTADDRENADCDRLSVPIAEDVDSRERRERDARIEASTIAQLAHAYTKLAHRWLRQHRPPTTDPLVAEALQIISWDHVFITVKLHRALSGYERECDAKGRVTGPIQTDFNGSAKVALISIERSEAAWRAMASVAPGDSPLVFADQLAQLRTEVEMSFPAARAFVRPGFDSAGP